MHTLWSVKGGSGVTVSAVALVVGRSRRHGGALLVDLCGDIPAALGLPEPTGPGLWDWMLTPDRTAAAIERLRVRVDDGLWLLPAGSPDAAATWRAEPAQAGPEGLADTLVTLADQVVIDAGTCFAPPWDGPRDEVVRQLAGAGRSWLVLRPCYLAIRRALVAAEPADGVILLSEPGRALDRRDVSQVLSTPVVAALEIDPSIARSVDAGLLARRPHRQLERGLRGVR